MRSAYLVISARRPGVMAMTGASSRSFGIWVGRRKWLTWVIAFRFHCAQRAKALVILSAVPGRVSDRFDGLAFGALPEGGALRFRTPLIALVHQPLALDPGLDAMQADVFRESERAALGAAARVVVTSEATARIVTADYSAPSQRISVVRPGNDPVPPARGSNEGRCSASLGRIGGARQRIRSADRGSCYDCRPALAADHRW